MAGLFTHGERSAHESAWVWRSGAWRIPRDEAVPDWAALIGSRRALCAGAPPPSYRGCIERAHALLAASPSERPALRERPPTLPAALVPFSH
jgi:hypothetical protein